VPPEIDEWTIHARLALAQQVVGHMQTDGHVSIRTEKASYDFDYLTKSSLLMKARLIFSALHVAVLISEDGIEQNGNRTRVTMRVTLTCGEGDSLSVVRSAYGNDPFDKGPQKGGTTAVRLALGDLLMQGGGDVDEHEAIPFTQNVVASGDRPATVDQLRFATDLVMRLGLDKAMPTATHAVLRLSRPITQGEIGPGLPVEDAIRLIPAAAASKLIERLEALKPGPAVPKAVWDKVAEWEVEGGYSKSVEPEDTKLPDAPPASDDDVPF
jgi:hypothetical protein